MPKRPNRNKRGDAPHVRFYGWLLNSPAYLSLSCPARALLVEVTRLYNGVPVAESAICTGLTNIGSGLVTEFTY